METKMEGLNILERAQKQLGEHSSRRQKQRKSHMKETRRVCDTCPQQPFTLPDTPWQHCENTLTFLRRETLYVQCSHYFAAAWGHVPVLPDTEGARNELPLEAPWWLLSEGRALVQPMDRLQSWRQRERGSYRGHEVLTAVLYLGNYKNSDMTNAHNMCARSQNYYYLCSSLQSMSII